MREDIRLMIPRYANCMLTGLSRRYIYQDILLKQIDSVIPMIWSVLSASASRWRVCEFDGLVLPYLLVTTSFYLKKVPGSWYLTSDVSPEATNLLGITCFPRKYDGSRPAEKEGVTSHLADLTHYMTMAVAGD